jgi:hypothetical protein
MLVDVGFLKQLNFFRLNRNSQLSLNHVLAELQAILDAIEQLDQNEVS